MPPLINWNAETEVALFYAMRGQKPVGINKHFRMIAIHKKFCQTLGQSVASEQIWQHLGTMYNLRALDESEAVSPSKSNQSEFKLPGEILNYRGPGHSGGGNRTSDSSFDEGSSTSSKKNIRKRRHDKVASGGNSSPQTPSSSSSTPNVKRRRQ